MCLGESVSSWAEKFEVACGSTAEVEPHTIFGPRDLFDELASTVKKSFPESVVLIRLSRIERFESGLVISASGSRERQVTQDNQVLSE